MPSKSQNKRGVRNGIEADSFSRRGRKKLSPDNGGAMNKPIPRVVPRAAIASLSHSDLLDVQP